MAKKSPFELSETKLRDVHDYCRTNSPTCPPHHVLSVQTPSHTYQGVPTYSLPCAVDRHRAQYQTMRRFLVSIALVASLVLVVACGSSEKETTAPTGTPAATAAPTGGGPLPVSAQATVTASGLKIIEIKIGTGAEAQKGQTVSVHYTGWLADGTKFDSSLDRGQPLSFALGAGQLIPGFDEGVVGMRVGGQRRLIIPPDLAYGPQGRPPVIPPNAELTFDVQLVGLQ